MKISFSEDGREAEMRVAKTEAALDAVRMAAYVLSDRAYALVDEDEESYIVRLRGKTTDVEGAGLAALFEREAENQKLRLSLSAANRETMEYIVSRALAPSGRSARPSGEAALSDEQQGEIDRLIAEAEAEIAALRENTPGSDPLGITKTWEEKNAKSGDG